MKTYVLSPLAGAFKADDGTVVVLSHLTDPNTSVLVSDDGQNFRQLFNVQSEWNGSDGQDRQFIECIDPQNPKAHPALVREGATLTFRDRQYRQVDDVIEAQFEPLPTTRVVFCFYALVDGRFFYVSELKFDGFWPIGGWRAYIGTGDAMERTRVTGAGFERMPRVETEAGTLWFASWHNQHPYWQPNDSSDKITACRADPKDYDIAETDEGVTISTKASAKV